MPVLRISAVDLRYGLKHPVAGLHTEGIVEQFEILYIRADDIIGPARIFLKDLFGLLTEIFLSLIHIFLLKTLVFAFIFFRAF